MLYGHYDHTPEFTSGIRTYGRVHLDLGAQTSPVDREWRALGRLRAGRLMGDAPVQRSFLLGGMGTVPGHAFRSYAGDWSALIQVEARRELRSPWISARVSGAAGMIDMNRARITARWPGVREGAPTALGAGIGLVNDILWLDVWRGFGDDGDWEVLLTVDPELWDIL